MMVFNIEKMLVIKTVESLVCYFLTAMMRFEVKSKKFYSSDCCIYDEAFKKACTKLS